MSYNPEDDARIHIPLIDLDIGFCLRIVILPCSPKPSVFVETLLPALLKAFVAYEGPDAKHVVHKLTGRSALKSTRLLLNDAIEAIPEVGLLDSAATRFVFDLIGVVDVLAWWLFLADIAYDFFIDWSTSIYQVSGCLPEEGRYWERSGDNNCEYTCNQGYLNACAWTNCDTSDGFKTNAGSIITPPVGQYWNVQWTSEWEAIAGGAVPTNMRVQDVTANKTIDSAPAFSDLFDKKTWSIVGAFNQYQTEDEHQYNLQATNASETSIIVAVGKNGGYYYETHTKTPSPIDVNFKPPWKA